MNLMRELPVRDAQGNVHVVVESPRGARVKLVYDAAYAAFVWSRTLPRGVAFPYDFGFVPQTLADDGDALDALILAEHSAATGVIVPARVVGALRIEQQRDGGPIKRNDRVVVVPVFDGVAASIADLGDIPQRTLAELEAFYHASLALTGKRVQLRGWADAAEAEQLVAAAAARFTTA